MKRSKELTPLSWDHHTGLTIAKRIPERLEAGVAPSALAAYVREHWRGHLLEHFEKEEHLLVPHLQGDAEGQTLNRRLVNEHREIAQLVERLEAEEEGTVRDALEALAAALKAHIKFEEAQYFPAVEARVEGEILAGLGQVLHREHQSADPRHDLP